MKPLYLVPAMKETDKLVAEDRRLTPGYVDTERRLDRIYAVRESYARAPFGWPREFHHRLLRQIERVRA